MQTPYFAASKFYNMITTHLLFNGNAEEAFNFYKSVLGGRFVYLLRSGFLSSSKPMSTEEKNKIMHISLITPDDIILTGSDFLILNGETFMPGNNFFISLSTDSQEKAAEWFNGLSGGGKIITPNLKSPWDGGSMGMVTDQFGIRWMISYREKKE